MQRLHIAERGCSILLAPGGHELGILHWGRPEKWLFELGGRIVFIVRLGLTKEGNQDGHVGVALDIVQNLRIDWKELAGRIWTAG